MEVYLQPVSFCISASFNWTHYTESLVFSAEIPELSKNPPDKNI